MIDALIIDDNREFVEMLSKMLGVLDVSARVAYGPRAGIMAIQKKIPDVLFLDLNMHGVDGFEVLAYIRRMPDFAETPVIVITADNQPETAKRAEEAGAIDLLVKPPTLGLIEAALKEVNLLR